MQSHTTAHEGVQQREGCDEHVEVTIVAQTNAIAQPGAVVVEVQHAIVADGAVPVNFRNLSKISPTLTMSVEV